MNAPQVHNPDARKPKPFQAAVTPMPGETLDDWIARDMAARGRADGHMGRLPGITHHAEVNRKMPEITARRDRLFAWMTGKRPMTLGDIAHQVGHDWDATKNDLYAMLQDGRVTLHPSNNSYRLYGAVKPIAPVTVRRPLKPTSPTHRHAAAIRRSELVEWMRGKGPLSLSDMPKKYQANSKDLIRMVDATMMIVARNVSGRNMYEVVA